MHPPHQNTLTPDENKFHAGNGGDGGIVLTGSFNFTKAAEESNAENLLVINDPILAAKYTSNWKDHLAHSPAYPE